MTPFANATTPTKLALGTALALGAMGLFLLVASNALLWRIGTRPGLRPNPRREGRWLCRSEPAQLAGFSCRAGCQEGELGSVGGISCSEWAGSPSVRPARGERPHCALQSARLCAQR